MEQVIDQTTTKFVDRRNSDSAARTGQTPERRQFTNSHTGSDPNVAELATAVDQYKLRHRRRFITFDELYEVMRSLGYSK